MEVERVSAASKGSVLGFQYFRLNPEIQNHQITMLSKLDLPLDVIRRLEDAGLETMLTGSMALNHYAQPRMTRDIDIVLALLITDLDLLPEIFDEEFRRKSPRHRRGYRIFTAMVSKIEPDRYADTGFSIADTPPDLNAHLFRQAASASSSAAPWPTPPANSSGPEFRERLSRGRGARFSFRGSTTGHSKPEWASIF